MTDKIVRYRKLARSLAKLGDEHAKAITTGRYRLMYHYFIRCCSLTSATILLVENSHFSAAYALQKSIVDSMLNGLLNGGFRCADHFGDAVNVIGHRRSPG